MLSNWNCTSDSGTIRLPTAARYSRNKTFLRRKKEQNTIGSMWNISQRAMKFRHAINCADGYNQEESIWDFATFDAQWEVKLYVMQLCKLSNDWQTTLSQFNINRTRHLSMGKFEAGNYREIAFYVLYSKQTIGEFIFPFASEHAISGVRPMPRRSILYTLYQSAKKKKFRRCFDVFVCLF